MRSICYFHTANILQSFLFPTFIAHAVFQTPLLCQLARKRLVQNCCLAHGKVVGNLLQSFLSFVELGKSSSMRSTMRCCSESGGRGKAQLSILLLLTIAMVVAEAIESNS